MNDIDIPKVVCPFCLSELFEEEGDLKVFQCGTRMLNDEVYGISEDCSYRQIEHQKDLLQKIATAGEDLLDKLFVGACSVSGARSTSIYQEAQAECEKLSSLLSSYSQEQYFKEQYNERVEGEN